ncbi:MAG TPA: hypothetical protein VLL05_04530 [Terriglobales bacterium]|nr:hypothetical protein [Terriglobales bacterium]
MTPSSCPTSVETVPDNQPTPLQELARLEIRRRQLLRDLVAVENERKQFLLEAQFQGLTIPN